MKAGSAVDIVTILDRGFVLLGIKGQNVPSIAEKQMFVIELKSQYPNLTIGELDLAFRLASRGQLDFDAETYQNFSMLYLNRLLSSYSRYIMKTYLSGTQRPPDESKQLPEQSSKELNDEMISIAFEHYKKNKDWKSIPGSLAVFRILWETDDEISMIPAEFVLAETKKRMSEIYHSIPDPKQRREFRDKMLDDDHMELQCRRMAVALLFDSKLSK